jgi:autotransporter-associated beta strand protein/YVTN family beta-propeller protein
LAAASTVTVETGATLGGSGTINGNVTVIAGGTLDLSSGLTINGTVTYTLASTFTRLNAYPAVVNPGTPLRFVATIFSTPLATTGSVTFTDMTTGTTLASNVPVIVDLNPDGIALTTLMLSGPLGPHTIKAAYTPADTIHTSSSGTTTVLVVAPAQPGTLLYVPAVSDNLVYMYTTASDGSLMSYGFTIATGQNGVTPLFAAMRGDQAFAYISNNASDFGGPQYGSISVIDTKTQYIGQTVSISASSSAYQIVVSPDGSKVYAAVQGGAPLQSTIRVFSADPASGQLTPSATISNGLGANLSGIAISPDGSRLYVGDQTGGAVDIINTATNAVIASVTLPMPIGNSPAPVSVKVSKDGSRLYAADLFNGVIDVIDTSLIGTASNPVIASSPRMNDPSAIAITPDGKYYYAVGANGSTPTISQFNAATNTRIASDVTIPGQSSVGLTISPDGAFLYTGVGILAIDPGSGVVVYGNFFVDGGVGMENSAMCSNGNAMLATGLTFFANTAGAINCTGNTPTFAGGTLKIKGTGITIPQSFTLGTGGGTIDNNGNNVTFSGAFTGSGALTTTGSAIVTFSGTNTNSGSTTVNGGTLQAGAANTLSASSAITVSGGATLDLNNTSQTIASLAGSGAVTLGSGTLTVGGDNTSTTFAGGISGTGGITKIGAGTLVLSGTNSYTGATKVSAGTLTVNGSLVGPTTVTVASGTTLNGSGTIYGTVTVAPGGTLDLSSGLVIKAKKRAGQITSQ